MRPRGSPPTPSARSIASEPVGITSTWATSSPPRRMIEPSPNCFLITLSASVMARCLFCGLRSDSWVTGLSLLAVGERVCARHAPSQRACRPQPRVALVRPSGATGRAVRRPDETRTPPDSPLARLRAFLRVVHRVAREELPQLLLARGGVLVAEVDQRGGEVAVEEQVGEEVALVVRLAAREPLDEPPGDAPVHLDLSLRDEVGGHRADVERGPHAHRLER